MKIARVTRILTAALVVCIGLSIFAAEVCARIPVPSYDWPQFRGPNRDGISTETGLLKKWPEGGPKLLWSVENKLGQGFSSLTIVDGLIYTTGLVDKRGILFAFDLNGKIVWEKDYGPEWTGSHKGTRTTPTYDEGKLYVINGYAKVVCLNAKTGDIIWEVDCKEKFGSQKIKWGISESPLIIDDKVICTPGGKGATMVALNKKTGETVWVTKELSDKASYSSPIVFDRGPNRIIAAITDTHVVAINARSGKVLWKDAFADYQQGDENPKAINPPSPVYHNGCVYTTSGYNDGGAMYEPSADGTKFKRKWVDKVLDNHHGGVVILDGYIYGSNWLSNGKGNWVCLDWETGKVMYETEWENKGPIIYADGLMYCYDERKGNLALVKPNPEKFEVVSSFVITKGDDKHWGHPAISNGVMYVRHSHALMAYKIKAQ